MCRDFEGNIREALIALRDNPSKAAYLFLLHNSATGDLAHIVPILRNPQIKVLVLGGVDGANSKPATGHMNLGEILVREFRVPGNQVARAVARTKRNVDKDIASSIAAAKAELKTIPVPFTQVYDLGDATKIIRWQFLNQGAERVFGKGKEGRAPDAVLGNDRRRPESIRDSIYAGVGGTPIPGPFKTYWQKPA
jgi:hypothetical protein